MLYERWREIVRLNRDRIAVRDVRLGQHFTFGQLDARVEQGRTEGEILFPSGHDAEFILDTLRAWRAGLVLCPLEAGHKPLEIPKPPGHIVHLKMTSATTGAPRLVAFTAPQLMADAENIMATMGLRADWPNLGVISLAHSYGFSNLVLPLLLHGIPLILLDSALPEILRRTADAELGITLAAVPALWRAWHDAQAISANVRLAISAGAPLPLPLERSVFSRFNLKIHNFLWQQRMRRNCLRPHRRAAERKRLRRFGDERGRVSVG